MKKKPATKLVKPSVVTPKETPQKKKGYSPSQARRDIASLDYFYEKCDAKCISDEDYVKLKAAIFKRLSDSVK
jgi:hypothetical protein